MNSFKEKIINKKSGILSFGITPPKSSNSHEQILQIASTQIERISKLNIDALLIYDIQDESDRTSEKRPYEFISTIDPSIYANQYLSELPIPKVIYRCVGNYPKNEFINWMYSGIDEFSVFVGTASADQNITIGLQEAYTRAKEVKNPLIIGGVTIPERHAEKQREHLKLQNKVENGCEYFVSQCVYDVEISKAFLRDYKKHFKKNGLDIKPIIFTLTPCGSQKTMDFIKWLGIRIPEWVENKLKNTEDMLGMSIDLVKIFYHELFSYAKLLDIPVGCNVESVSIRKEEIVAAIELCHYINRIYS